MFRIKDLLARIPAGEYKLELCFASLMGLAAGLGALILEYCVSMLGTVRLQLMDQASPMIVLPAMGLFGGLVAGAMVEKIAPTASGSGIPQVRAYLLGKTVPLDFKVMFVKLVGGSIALGSGLFSGREGPTVHAGAAIAKQLSKLLSVPDTTTRQLVAAGAGAGLAAAFNAPLAGVLFVAEELLKDVSVSTMRMALAACFVSSVTTRLLQAPHMEANKQISAIVLSFAWQDIAFWVILGLLCGFLGTFFNKAVLWCCHINRDVMKISLPLRVALAGLICGTTIAVLMPIHHFQNYAAMRSLFATHSMDASTLLLGFVTFFFLSVVVYGSGSPGGLFAPTLVLGSSLGAIVAHFEMMMFGVGSLETMALIGMGAFFAAVARVPLTALVIIVEMTGHYHLVLPLMITIASAVLVASRMESRSVYDMLREFAGLGGEEEPAQTVQYARDEMSTKFFVIGADESAIRLQEIAANAQPVVITKDGHPQGIISTAKLLNYIKLPDDLTIGSLVDDKTVMVAPDERLERIRQLRKEGAGTLLVVQDGAVVGVIS